MRGVRSAGDWSHRHARTAGALAQVPSLPRSPHGAASGAGHGPRARQVQGGRGGGELHRRDPRGSRARHPRGGGDRTKKGRGARQTPAAGSDIRPDRHGRRGIHRRGRHGGRAGVHLGLRRRGAAGPRIGLRPRRYRQRRTARDGPDARASVGGCRRREGVRREVPRPRRVPRRQGVHVGWRVVRAARARRSVPAVRADARGGAREGEHHRRRGGYPAHRRRLRFGRSLRVGFQRVWRAGRGPAAGEAQRGDGQPHAHPARVAVWRRAHALLRRQPSASDGEPGRSERQETKERARHGHRGGPHREV